jgi:hypothetical protein
MPPGVQAAVPEGFTLVTCVAPKVEKEVTEVAAVTAEGAPAEGAAPAEGEKKEGAPAAKAEGGGDEKKK